jgi:hypothetical protein
MGLTSSTRPAERRLPCNELEKLGQRLRPVQPIWLMVALAMLLINQAFPTAGLSGSLIVVRALRKRAELAAATRPNGYPRSASKGSVRVTRHAGTIEASSDARVITAKATPNARESRGLTL